MATIKQFTSLASYQIDRGIYVWGAQGQLLKDITESWIRSKETSTSTADKAIAMWKKRKDISGARAFDCSGLVCWCLAECGAMPKNFDTKARWLFADYCDKITKSQLRDGDLCFKYSSSKGYISHVGIYCGGEIIEAKGRDDGVVKSSLTSSWDYFGRLKVFASEDPVFVLTRLLKKGCKGDDVKAWQEALIKKGYRLQNWRGSLPNNGADGDFGKITDEKTRSFQIDVGFTGKDVDGIVGKKTCAKMGWTWK